MKKKLSVSRARKEFSKVSDYKLFRRTMLDLHTFRKCPPVLLIQKMRISNAKKNGVDWLDFRFTLVLFLTVKAVYTLGVRVNGDKGGPDGNNRQEVKVLDSDGQIL